MSKQEILLLACLLPFMGLLGCARDTVRVTGEVVRVRGDQMPSPDLPPSNPPGFETTLYFFEPFRAADAERVDGNGTYRDIRSPLKGSAKSDSNGRFALRLPAGRYSLLIGRDSLYYTNIQDGEGYLNPVEVGKRGENRIRLKADWDAVY